jgi:peptidoglycan hydrolase-like protein with peptidoglycan-binding domain
MRSRVQILLVVFVCISFLISVTNLGAFAQEQKPAVQKEVQGAKTALKVAKENLPKEKVMAIQEALNKTGATLKVDGLMGKKTAAALKKFQKANSLKVTGKADEATLAKLGIQ